MKLLLDGSKMRESLFYKKFKEIVGVSNEAWEKRSNVTKDNGSEYYSSQDEKFLFCGTAYDPPKLYRKDRAAKHRNSAKLTDNSRRNVMRCSHK